MPSFLFLPQRQEDTKRHKEFKTGRQGCLLRVSLCLSALVALSSLAPTINPFNNRLYMLSTDNLSALS